MRGACLTSIHELARQDQRVFFIGSDLGKGALEAMRQEFPGRFLMEGISEQHIVGMAAGLAMEGKIPYVNTIASFLTRRCYEQVVLDVCLQNLPVRLVGNGAGLVYAPLGPTHQTVEDIAIFRALPNMCILAPADADEMRRIMPLTLSWPGPIYIRLAKGYDPIVTRANPAPAIGKALVYHPGVDALIVTTGVCLGMALAARDMLGDRGVDAGVLHMPCVKPLDAETLLDQADQVSAVVTVEEHSVLGGLGGAVLEVLAEARTKKPKRMRRLGIPDVFPEHYGSQAALLNHFGLSADNVARTVLELLKD